MSLWEGIKSLLGGGQAGATRDASRLYVVDAERLAEGRGGGIGPMERLQTLQRLAQFAGREKIRVKAVIGGRPLREVAHGGDFNGITVYYAENAADASDQIAKACRGNTTVVTADAAVEQRVRQQGFSTMKTSTLRKAFEGESAGPEMRGGDRSQQRRRGGGDRPRRDRGDRGDRGGRGERNQRPDASGETPSEDSEPQQRQDRQEPGADTTVKNLIDLVE